MKHYYYTDPLAAAWMTKHFEMRFCSEEGYDLLPEDFYRYEKLYINHGDLLILNPKEGDVIYFTAELVEDIAEACGEKYKTELTIASDTDIMLFNKGEESYRLERIVERNGLTFMWPKSEDV